jgi:hypothetical protein
MSWNTAIATATANVQPRPIERDFNTVLARLPGPVREKVHALRQKRQDARAMMEAVMEERDEVRELTNADEIRLRELTNAFQDGGFQKSADSPAVIAQAAKIAERKQHRARIEAAYEVRAANWQTVGRIFSHNIEPYCLNLPADVEIKLHPQHAPKNDETFPLAAVERARKKLTELRVELTNVRAAPITRDEALAIAKAQVRKLADQGQPNVRGLLARGDEIGWPTQVVSFTTRTANDIGITHIDVTHNLALTAWLHPKLVIERLIEEIDAKANFTDALSAPERAKRESQLLDAILACEREECFWIEKAASQGTEVPYRTDTDARAVLGLSSDMPAPVS